VCGKADRILADLAATGADALELDQRTSLTLAHAELRNRCTFIGNLDPSAVLCLGTPASVTEKTRELLDVFRDTPRLIVNAGCALPSTTPRENLLAMIRTVRHESEIL
jgi:uroporphyrinogen decarboxylase